MHRTGIVPPHPQPSGTTVIMMYGLFILGSLSMVVQAAFLREIFAAFRGGDLTVGAALLSWLLWAALGCGALGRIVRLSRPPGHLFASLFPVYGILGYLSVIFTGSSPYLFHLLRGELVPYDLQFAAAILFPAPFNLLGGFLFALGVQATEHPHSPSAGKAFTIEALGAAAGGFLFSLALVRILPNALIALCCPAAALLFSGAFSLRRRERISPALVLLYVLLASGAFVFHARTAGYPWRGQALIAEHDTQYGRLRVTRTGEQITFTSDASTLFSAPNPEAGENAVHFPMLAASRRDRVLILGGGPGGAIDEAVKYRDAASITAVELDPLVFTLAERHLDERWRNDPRVVTVAADPRAFLARTSTRFDVIIMNMPAPLSGLANRFYTREFFRLAASRLTPDGVFGFALDGSEEYLPPELARFLASVRDGLRAAFPSTIELPGVECRFLASRRPGALDGLDWERIETTRASLGIETSFVRGPFLRYVMSPERMESLKTSLDSAVDPPVNTDTRPAGYLMRTEIQGEADASRVTRFLELSGKPRALTAILAALLIGILIPILLPRRNAAEGAAASCVFALGFTGISFTIVAIMAYQSFFGYLYGRIALLTGSYMAGLALGGSLGMRAVSQGKTGMRILALTQAGIALTALLWMLLLAAGGHAAAEPGYFLLSALSGLIGGFQFTIADARYRAIHRDASAGGTVYGFDLIGSSVGALLTGALFIPTIGMYPSLLFLAGLNLAAAGVARLRGSGPSGS
jgi:spermidine synthase